MKRSDVMTADVFRAQLVNLQVKGDSVPQKLFFFDMKAPRVEDGMPVIDLVLRSVEVSDTSKLDDYYFLRFSGPDNPKIPVLACKDVYEKLSVEERVVNSGM